MNCGGIKARELSERIISSTGATNSSNKKKKRERSAFEAHRPVKLDVEP